jgi:hypothetical protein
MRKSSLRTAFVVFASVMVTGRMGYTQDARTDTQVRAGVSQTIPGVVVTLDELRSRPQPVPFARPREANPRRTFDGSLPPTPPASASAGNGIGSASGQIVGSPDLPQAPVDEILGLKFTDTAGFVPPDTMGAVGPTQFLFSVNTHLRAFNKNTPHTQIFDIDEQAFWGSTADPSGVSDTHVRYDRAIQRWFIIEIDVKSAANHILLAVSSSSDLSTATWTQYQLPGTGATAATDQNCFADYDTPGIDQNAIYIGANMFGSSVAPCSGFNYKHSNLYVIQKASTLTGTAHLTTFYNVVGGTFGIATIQGVDSVDSLTTGYAVAVNETESPSAHLSVWQINNPGTASPTLSLPTLVAVNAENGARGGVLSANNVASANPTRPMDDIDDRLFSAVIRNGHLWTAHNVGVDSTGNSNGGARTRDAVRWYDLNVPGLTLNQSGTVFDGAASGFLEYWMGTVMVSGQGHVAMGLNRANSATVVQAGAVGRLAGDPANTMQGFSLFQSSTADAYTDASFVPNPANRWGDYTYTSLDPCDDMTMWTAQEYVAGATASVDWGVAAEKLQAPAPATPASANPAFVAPGQASVDVIITGTQTSGSGFYDTPSTITDPCRKRIGSTVSGSVTLNSITFTDPSHVTLNLSTIGAPTGAKNVTITNPDGQAATTTSLLTVIAPPTISKAFGVATIPLNGLTSLSFTITNPAANTLSLTGVGFTDTLPAGLVVSTPNGLTGSCGGGTITATAGTGTVSLSGATLGVGGSCTFSTNVTGTSAGAQNNSVTVSTTNAGTGNTSNTSLTVVAPPTIGKSFGAASIPLNGSTTLTFNLSNPNSATSLSGIGFTDTIPSGLVVSTPSGLTGSCGGGTITAAAGSGSVSLSGATLAANTSCSFAVSVTGIATATQNNMTGTVTSTQGGTGGTASASITVSAHGYFTVAPCRVADTRGSSGPYGGPALAANTDRTFVVAGQCGIPPAAVAVAFNFAVTQPTGQGDLRTVPGGGTLPLVSTMNWRPGQTRANNAITSLGPSGDIVVHVDQASGSVHLIIDVNGYFQ